LPRAERLGRAADRPATRPESPRQPLRAGAREPGRTRPLRRPSAVAKPRAHRPNPALRQDRRNQMSKLVADYILERLRAWDVHRIYGYPGDGINALLGALDRADGDPELIQVRHEEMAAFMACGHAKFTGEVGVCMATSGPGAIHLL